MYVDNPFKSPVVLSLCPGFLGLERGLERAIGKINVAAYVEIEAFICENLVAGMESGILAPAPIWTDVKTFPAKGFREKVHGIIGGYPCQPFSVAGKQKGKEDPRHLWPYIQHHINTIRPVWCFFENVRGHLKLGYDEVYRSLSEMGYAVEPGIFTAEEVGAPHQRERLFILAIRKDFLEDSAKSGIWDFSGFTGGGIREQDVQQGDWAAGSVWAESASREGGAMENTYSKSDRNNDGRFYAKTASTSETELGDTDNDGYTSTQEFRGGKTSGYERRTKKQTKTGKLKRTSGSGNSSGISGSEKGSKQLWDTDNDGLQGRISNIGSECGDERTLGPAGSHWPAGPDEQQYEWEEPRTIESGVGCTIDGYNFREDLLRAYGNSVVEQTAELAFITLLNKHIENANRYSDKENL